MKKLIEKYGKVRVTLALFAFVIILGLMLHFGVDADVAANLNQ